MEQYVSYCAIAVYQVESEDEMVRNRCKAMYDHRLEQMLTRYGINDIEDGS